MEFTDRMQNKYNASFTGLCCHRLKRSLLVNLVTSVNLLFTSHSMYVLGITNGAKAVWVVVLSKAEYSFPTLKK